MHTIFVVIRIVNILPDDLGYLAFPRDLRKPTYHYGSSSSSSLFRHGLLSRLTILAFTQFQREYKFHPAFVNKTPSTTVALYFSFDHSSKLFQFRQGNENRISISVFPRKWIKDFCMKAKIALTLVSKLFTRRLAKWILKGQLLCSTFILLVNGRKIRVTKPKS